MGRSIKEELNSITYIKENFPELFKKSKKYYCDKSLYANYNFFNTKNHNIVLGDNIQLDLTITLNEDPDYYQGNFYKISTFDIEELKSVYCKELNNVKINNNFNDQELLQITSTLDKYLFRMESILCKPSLLQKVLTQ